MSVTGHTCERSPYRFRLMAQSQKKAPDDARLDETRKLIEKMDDLIRRVRRTLLPDRKLKLIDSDTEADTKK